MAKTDKELTSEIVCEFIRAWGTQNNCLTVKSEVLPNVIKIVYNAIHSLEVSESDSEE